jgi:hypothetical protein
LGECGGGIMPGKDFEMAMPSPPALRHGFVHLSGFADR